MPQRASLPSTPSLWLRWVTFAGILLILLASTAQASHIHSDWLPHQPGQLEAQADGASLPGSEAACPLCVGMHSALTSSQGSGAIGEAPTEQRFFTSVTYDGLGEQYFQLFSRPPPFALVN